MCSKISSLKSMCGVPTIHQISTHFTLFLQTRHRVTANARCNALTITSWLGTHALMIDVYESTCCLQLKKISVSGDFGNFCDFWTSSKKMLFWHTTSLLLLVKCVVTASSCTLWLVFWNKVAIWILIHCWVDTPHTHSSEVDSLFSPKFFALYPQSHVKSTGIVSTKLLFMNVLD